MTIRQHQMRLRNALAAPSTVSQFDLGWHSRTASAGESPKPVKFKLVYQWERFPDVMKEMVPLLHQHYKETGTFTNDVPLDLNFEQYCFMDQAGVLKVLTARFDGKLVGYLLTVIGAHLNFVSTMFSTAHMYYLVPSHRRGWNGVRMFREWIKAAENSGIRVLQVSETLRVRGKHGKRVNVLLKYLGFRMMERNYTRLIGD